MIPDDPVLITQSTHPVDEVAEFTVQDGFLKSPQAFGGKNPHPGRVEVAPVDSAGIGALVLVLSGHPVDKLLQQHPGVDHVDIPGITLILVGEFDERIIFRPHPDIIVVGNQRGSFIVDYGKGEPLTPA